MTRLTEAGVLRVPYNPRGFGWDAALPLGNRENRRGSVADGIPTQSVGTSLCAHDCRFWFQPVLRESDAIPSFPRSSVGMPSSTLPRRVLDRGAGRHASSQYPAM